MLSTNFQYLFDSLIGISLAFGLVKILDFGCATERLKTSSRAGAINATAPEIFLAGRKNADYSKNDIWAVGCIIYEMLGFGHPIDWSLGRFKPFDPEKKFPRLDKVVRCCLQFDPNDRPDADRLCFLCQKLLFIGESKEIEEKKKESNDINSLGEFGGAIEEKEEKEKEEEEDDEMDKKVLELYNSMLKTLRKRSNVFGHFENQVDRSRVKFLLNLLTPSEIVREVGYNKSLNYIMEKSPVMEFDELKIRELAITLQNMGSFDFEIKSWIKQLSDTKSFSPKKNMNFSINLLNERIKKFENIENEQFEKDDLKITKFRFNMLVGRGDATHITTQGENSLVFDVEHVTTRRRYAMKVLLNTYKNVVSTNDFLDRFEEQEMKNPYYKEIPSWQGGEGGDYTVAILMELYDMTLKEYVENRRLGRFEILSIMIQLCSCVKEMVKVGILHNDIKLENVLVSRTSSYPRVVLSDFGCQQKFGGNIKKVMGYALGVKGNLVFNTPEIKTTKGDETADVSRAELFSFGLIGLNFLLGEYPFFVIDKIYKNVENKYPTDQINVKDVRRILDHHRNLYKDEKNEIEWEFLFKDIAPWVKSKDI